MKFLILATFLATSAIAVPNLIVDYRCMSNIVCACLLGGIKSDDDSYGIGQINNMTITGTKPLTLVDPTNMPLNRSGIITDVSYCSTSHKIGSKTVDSSSSSPSVFQYPPINTLESWADNYNRCVKQSENVAYFAASKKHIMDNNLSPGDTFYLTLLNVPDKACNDAYI